MIVVIILLIIFLCLSVFLNVRLFKECDSLTNFFIDMEEDVNNDYKFFDKMCKTNLLMNDPFVVELIERLKKTTKKFDIYSDTIKRMK